MTHESKHTPGPWKACQWGSTIRVGTAPSGNFPTLAVVNPYGDSSLGIPDPQDTANARLIAAAPDMLEALEVAENDLSQWAGLDEDYPDSDTGRALETVRAAIARATEGE